MVNWVNSTGTNDFMPPITAGTDNEVFIGADHVVVL